MAELNVKPMNISWYKFYSTGLVLLQTGCHATLCTTANVTN